MPPGASSMTSAVGLTISSTSGCSTRNSDSRGISQLIAKAEVVVTCSGRQPSLPVTSSTARSMVRKAPCSAAASRSPSGVIAPRRSRRISETPSRSSSARTCWLTAAWLTFRASPARVKLPFSARAVNARKALREGRVRQSIRKHRGYVIKYYLTCTPPGTGSIRQRASLPDHSPVIKL